MTQPPKRLKIDWSVACAGKESLSQERAMEIAKRQRRRDGRVSAYHCQCGGWHVGSKSGATRKYELAKRAARARVEEADE